MSVEETAPRTRRSLLAAGAGGLLAAVAATLGRPQAASAANGDPLLLGNANVETNVTTVTNDSAGTAVRVTQSSSDPTVVLENVGAITRGAALYAAAGPTVGSPDANMVIHARQTSSLQAQSAILGEVGSSAQTAIRGVGGSYGVLGTGTTAGIHGLSSTANASGVFGEAATGKGVYGLSTSSTGVRAVSNTGTAMWASSASGLGAQISTSGADKVGALVQHTTGKRAAIEGFAGPGTPPASGSETGVQGISNLSPDSVGVWGVSAVGTGVFGDTTNGYGVAGLGYYGVYGSGAAGVVGDVDGGTGVVGWTGVAFAPDPAAKVGVWAGAENGRTALDVHGVARFSRSGKVSFAAGQASKAITVAGGITATSLGFAMIQSDKSGYYVRAVVPSTSAGTIKVILNKSVTTTTTVAWQVIG